MFKKIALLADGAGDGTDGGGGGAPAGGSPEGGQDNPPKDDGEFVPKTQFIAALNSAERKREAEVSRLSTELAELRAQVKARPADQPKRYTRAELNAAVAAGQVTQDAADAQYELQIQQDAEDRAHRVALNTVSTAERKRLVDSDIARYTAVAPEILDETHETRQRIKEEFNSLVALGDPGAGPEGVVTQLKAIRAVLGPIARLEKARSGRFQHETHLETGGGGGAGGGRPKTGKLSDQLNAEAKRHYEKGIEQGRYKDWAAVEDELKYAKPATRQRFGIAT